MINGLPSWCSGSRVLAFRRILGVILGGRTCRKGHRYTTITKQCALIVFLLCCRCLSPLSRRGSDDVIDDTDEELYYLQKSQASKTPLFIPIQSHSLAPDLFYCIKTTRFKLLCATVVEPISSAWPVIATVTRWNPLARVGVVWAICMCCSYLAMPAMLRVVSGLVHLGDG